MKFSAIFWIMLSLFFGVGGWFLGRSSVSTEGARAAVVNSVDQSNTAAATSNKTPVQVPVQASSPVDRFRDACDCKDPMAQMAMFVQALEGITKENYREFSAQWTKLLARGRPPSGIDRLFNMRMGQVLGVATLSFRTGSEKDFQVLGSIKESLLGAMQTDPVGVKLWFDGLKNERFREGLLDGYVSGMATKDVTQALRFVGTLDPDLRQRSLAAVVSALRQSERPENLSAWFVSTAADPSLANSPVLPDLFNATLQASLAIRQSIPTAATLLEEHAGKAYVDLQQARGVAAKYAQENLKDALARAARMEATHPLADWCQKHVTGTLRELVLRNLVENAEAQDPALAQRIRGWLAAP
jgi:hypothetical protein